jgi:hypothetical protein
MIDIARNYFEASKNRELLAAGDNEKQQFNIRKKYADKEFAIKSATIIASTAVAIMKAWEQYGWPLALVPSAFLAATGIVELSAANTARKQVSQFAAGKNMPVIGADDGKTYNAPFIGNIKTGLYSQPTLGLFSEKKPEIIIDGNTTENIMLNFPELYRGIAFAASGAKAVRQYAEGMNVPAVVAEQTIVVNQSEQLASAVNTLNVILSRGIRAEVSHKQFREVDDEYNEIISSVSK